MRKLKKLLRKLSHAVIFIMMLVVFLLGELIFCSKATFRDFFTTEKVSALNDRPKHITKNIIVDALGISTNGGIKTLTENVINGIAEKRPNWYFTVLGRPDIEQPFNFKSNNIKIVYVDYSFSNALITICNILNFFTFGLVRDQLMQLLFYDNILFNKSSCDLYFDPYAEFVVNDYSIPKISVIHDILYFDVLKHFSNESVLWRKANAPKIITSSKKIITVSDFSRNKIIDSYNLNSDFVQTIHIKLANRIKNSERTPEFEKSTLEKFRLNAKKYLIYPSIVRTHKNHARLFQAFTKFMKHQNKICDLKLVIVGTVSPEVIKDLNKLIEENCDNKEQSEYIKNQIVFTNFIPNAELDILLSNALAMIFPSLYEGFGMPIIEAMNAGIPVACSNVTSLPEVAGNAALFFDPRNVDEITDTIDKIYRDKKLRNKLIQLGFERAKYFSDKNSMIDEYIKVFEQYMN